jgi:coproporphyrinogen III oxidase-like Fe-S oxidoreductase
MFALRLREGASLQRFAALAGQALSDKALQEVVTLGLLTVDGDRICATDRGVMMLNGILRALLADRQSAS